MADEQKIEIKLNFQSFFKDLDSLGKNITSDVQKGAEKSG